MAKKSPLILMPIVSVGLGTIALFLLTLFVWGYVAPLSSAAIAPGVVVVEGNTKIVQHLEGGIVTEILVREGDHVKAGQVLVRLDVTRAKSGLDLLKSRLIDSLAAAARLAAERDRKKEIIFPDFLLSKKSSPKILEIMKVEHNIFTVRYQATKEQVSIINKRIAQSAEEITGFEAQLKSQAIQLALITEEIEDVKTLIDKGLARKPRLLQLRRNQAQIIGEHGRITSSIARVNQRIGENKLTISVIGTSRINEAVSELKQIQSTIYDLYEQIRASEYVLLRTKIIAPIAGTVVDMQIHTAGGVIAPGEILMNIVPSDDRMIIDARVDPKDIDVVKAGREAQIRLTAYNQRHMSPITGQVLQVSPDKFDDPRTGEIYYLAKIELPTSLAEDFPNIQITPGMQAEVYINTGERTVFEYFLQPVERSFGRAFRED